MNVRLKYRIVSVLILLGAYSNAQQLIVESGNLSVYGNTAISLNNTSLKIEGSFTANDSSTLIVRGGKKNIVLEGSSKISLHNLEIQTDVRLKTNLTLSGDVVFKTGVLYLDNNNIELGGLLLNENENSRIFSLGTGEISKSFSLIPDIESNPGNLGLSLTSSKFVPNLEIRRGHKEQYNLSDESIYRYYTLSEEIGPIPIGLTYFDAELGNHTEENLKIWAGDFSSWLQIETNAVSESENSLTANLPENMKLIALFEAIEEMDVSIPTGFSPNGDGVNEFLIIEGVNNFPNNKLIVFNKWGDKLYEAEPYQNNWNGISHSLLTYSQNQLLPEGTYFYVFFKDKDDKTSVKKGFFEIKGTNK